MCSDTLKRLVIIGAGGHGRAIGEAAHMMNRWAKIVFLDDSFPEVVKGQDGVPILGRISDSADIITSNDECFVAIGNQDVRRRLISELLAQGRRLATVIHPRSWVSSAATIADGVAIMAGAVIGYQAKVGCGAIVNANATVDHDAVLEDFTHIGVGVQLAGGVIVRSGAWLQAGVCAGYRVVVPAESVVMPGTALREA